MLVSATERTRKTGIRTHFLIGAVVLPAADGTVGIPPGTESGYALAPFTDAPPVFTVISIPFAFAFPRAVGFGCYPAYKAPPFNPTDALKYE